MGVRLSGGYGQDQAQGEGVVRGRARTHACVCVLGGDGREVLRTSGMWLFEGSVG